MRISSDAAEAIMGPAPAVRYPIAGLTLGQIAGICHEAIRQIDIEQGKPASPHWSAVSDYLASVEAGRVLEVLNGGTAERKHAFWLHAKLEDGWKFGLVKDAQTKTDPKLVAWADLPDEAKVAGLLYDAIVTGLSDIYIHNHRGFMPDGTRIV